MENIHSIRLAEQRVAIWIKIHERMQEEERRLDSRKAELPTPQIREIAA